MSPGSCAGIGFWNQTEDGTAACRIHGLPNTHELASFPSLNATKPFNTIGATVPGGLNTTLHSRLSRKLGIRDEQKAAQVNPADLLHTQYHAGNLAAIRAPASNARISGASTEARQTAQPGPTQTTIVTTVTNGEKIITVTDVAVARKPMSTSKEATAVIEGTSSDSGRTDAPAATGDRETITEMMTSTVTVSLEAPNAECPSA